VLERPPVLHGQGLELADDVLQPLREEVPDVGVGAAALRVQEAQAGGEHVLGGVVPEGVGVGLPGRLEDHLGDDLEVGRGAKLVEEAPAQGAGVERVEHLVVRLRLEVLRQKLPLHVVNDHLLGGAVRSDPTPDPGDDLVEEDALAGAGGAHDEDVLRLQVPGKTQAADGEMVTCVPALGPAGCLQGLLQPRQGHLEGSAQEAGGGHVAGSVDKHQYVGDGEQVSGERPPADPGGLALEAVDVRPEQLSELPAVGGAANGERIVEKGPQLQGN